MTAPAGRLTMRADRRFHRGDLRAVRRRRVGQVLRRSLRRLAPVALVAAALTGLALAALESPALAITDVLIRGQGRLSAADLEARVSDLRGQNILRVDFDAARRRVLDSPWVADVTFGRVLPSTIELEITERVPLALARLGQQLYLVDDTGIIIDEFGPEHSQFDLPVVDGLFTPADADGPMLDAQRVRLAARLLAALASLPGLAGRVSQVDVSNPRNAAVLLADDPAWLHLGQRDFAGRMQTYLELSDTLHDRLPGLEWVDLRFDERIYVRASATRASTAR